MIRKGLFSWTVTVAVAVAVGGIWTLVSAQAPVPNVPPGGLAPPGAGGYVGGRAPGMTPSGDTFFYAQPDAAYTVGVIAADDPEAAKLALAEAEVAQEAEQLSEKYAAADKPDEQKRIKAELREALAKQFTVQHQRRELELARIEERVQKLRDQIKKRNDARESIIDRRLDQIINEADGLGWSPAGRPSGHGGMRFGTPGGHGGPPGMMRGGMGMPRGGATKTPMPSAR